MAGLTTKSVVNDVFASHFHQSRGADVRPKFGQAKMGSPEMPMKRCPGYYVLALKPSSE